MGGAMKTVFVPPFTDPLCPPTFPHPRSTHYASGIKLKVSSCLFKVCVPMSEYMTSSPHLLGTGFTLGTVFSIHMHGARG